jgi:hypothetical protein
MSPRLPALFAAQTVAMNARMGSLTLHAVDDLRTKAEELLGKADPLRAAILTFATMYEVHRRDEAALASMGETLERALRVALDVPHPAARPDPSQWPAPVDAERRDIHG